jgi:hypothetical protein
MTKRERQAVEYAAEARERAAEVDREIAEVPYVPWTPQTHRAWLERYFRLLRLSKEKQG